MNMPGFTAAYALESSVRKYDGTSVATQTSNVIRPQARVGGGGILRDLCVNLYQDCYIDCSVAHPDGASRESCERSCDFAFRICSGIFGLRSANVLRTPLRSVRA